MMDKFMARTGRDDLKTIDGRTMSSAGYSRMLMNKVTEVGALLKVNGGNRDQALTALRDPDLRECLKGTVVKNQIINSQEDELRVLVQKVKIKFKIEDKEIAEDGKKIDLDVVNHAEIVHIGRPTQEEIKTQVAAIRHLIDEYRHDYYETVIIPTLERIAIEKDETIHKYLLQDLKITKGQALLRIDADLDRIEDSTIEELTQAKKELQELRETIMVAGSGSQEEVIELMDEDREAAA